MADARLPGLIAPSHLQIAWRCSMTHALVRTLTVNLRHGRLCRTLALIALVGLAGAPARGDRLPNVLLAIADDQSWPDTSAAGSKAVNTPAFDRVARAGVRFTNAIAGSPGCSPSRAALLTGRHHWQLEQAGTHASSFPTTYATYPDLLEQAGYFVGFTGKGWGPGNWKVSGRRRNPAGPGFDEETLDPPLRGISKDDYAANFAAFLARRPSDKPFCFWYGGHEPHRNYEKASGLKTGKRLEDVTVPPYLPDVLEVRSDILDYCAEIEWFDRHLGRMLEILEKAGELDNTLVIVTADNGMSFPNSKANVHEYGIHVPLAIAWPRRVPGGRVVDDVVGFVDLTATILDAAGVEPSAPGPRAASTARVGRSLMNILTAKAQGRVDPDRERAFSGRERHSSARYDNLGYPARALRTDRYLYIRNFHPERWPAGDPRVYRGDGTLGPAHGAYHDIDGSPTLDFLVAHRDDPQIARFFHLAVDRRPAEELYDIVQDPGCLKNLAADREHAAVRDELRAALEQTLKATGDPRLGPDPEIWETYPRYSPIRKFPPPPAS
jgi:uncharacterized sulfatase